ncbi:MAG: hypothetical protein NTY74_09480 [Ignavibacteriae bacterium]|nr:hypothetical protein [Ignavibacteriota bacterium]
MEENFRKSKADNLLEGLSYKDTKKFNKFIVDYLGGSGEHILKYWEYRHSQKVLSGSFELSDSKEKFSRKIISDFVKILEKFYALKAFEKDSLGEKGYLIRELRDRQLYKLFNSLLDDTKQYHQSNVRKGYMNYINYFRLNLEEYFLYNSQNEDLSMFKTSVNLSSVSEIIYIQSKLFEHINQKLYCFNCEVKKGELNSIDNILDYVNQNADYIRADHQGVYVLYLICNMIENINDEKETHETLNYISKNFNHLTVNFLQLVYEIIIRFYILQVNLGNSKSLNDLYNIVKEIEKKDLFANIQHIQPLNFLTAISVSLAFRDVDFADAFLHKYNNKMNAEYRKNVTTICQAMIEFAKGRYTHTRNLLMKDKTKNISMYIFSKVTLLKSLYELNELRVVLPLIDTVKHYLSRHISVKGPYRDSIFTFLNYLNSMCTAKRKNGRGADRLLKKLNNDQAFFQKRWIVIKAEELKQMCVK